MMDIASCAKIISKTMACHYKNELTKGTTRSGVVLTKEQIAERREALERYVTSLDEEYGEQLQFLE